MLPDEGRGNMTRNWKDHRKTQYRSNGRGQQHTLTLGKEWRWGRLWDLEEYFKDHGIPYRIRRLYEVEVKTVTHQRVWTHLGTGHWVEYQRKVRPKKSKKKTLTTYETVRYWKEDWGWVWKDLPKPRECRYQIDKGYEVTWWSDKDIGIEYILGSISVL
jgi:hypothetical protein